MVLGVINTLFSITWRRIRYYCHMTDERQLVVQKREFRGKSVVYVMSRDQRAHDNHALLAAQAFALAHKVPLYVLFVLKNVKGRSREHYTFMLDGLKGVSDELALHNIVFVLRSGEARTEIMRFATETSCGALYFDFNPLAHARTLIDETSRLFSGFVAVVDTHNIIPAWIVSEKQEYAARTMRTKVHKRLEMFLVPPPQLQKHPFTASEVASLSFNEAVAYVHTVSLSGIVVDFISGESAAHERLEQFIAEDLGEYAWRRNDIAEDRQSGLSPYLHFGQISSLRVALNVMTTVGEIPLLFQQAKMTESSNTPNQADGMNTLFEEMIVRKELSDNFCLYNQSYLSLEGAPEWGRVTLAKHAADHRDFLYTTEQWEAAVTHDPAWNAAQLELTTCGKIHGYTRMYWAKKILEWSASPEEALKTAVYLNDKYSVDGGDPNGYVGILWSIAGLHDRPWFERSVYGTIRYMNEAGLRRKFDLDAYIRRWS